MASTTATNEPRDLGFPQGSVIQEYGWGDDADEQLREDIEDRVGAELVDEDYGDVVDGAIVWWRDGDDDLTDLLVDVLSLLEAGGLIWLFTPKPGRAGTVALSEIQEAASTAGLHATSTFPIAQEWTATKLAPAGRARSSS